MKKFVYVTLFLFCLGVAVYGFSVAMWLQLFAPLPEATSRFFVDFAMVGHYWPLYLKAFACIILGALGAFTFYKELE